jgi:hypothetical protein
MPTLTGTRFASELPATPGPARERAIYQPVVSGLTAPIVWAEVVVEWRGHRGRLRVSADALRIGNAEDSLRVTVNAETAQWIADHLETCLPPTKICDLVWEQAIVRVSPCLQTPDAEMAHTHRMVRHSREVDEKVRCRCGLIENVGKHWVLSNQLAGRPNQAANYGWFKADGTRWQNLGLAHDNQHVDYSQVVRLVRQEMIVDGVAMNIEEVGRSAELWGLVSSEGPLTVWRQPGTRPAPAPTPTVPSVDHDDPATWRELAMGMKGPDVSAWQRVLMAAGHDLSPWNDDGDFGRVTHNTTGAWQRARGLPATGVVDAATRGRIGTTPPPPPDTPLPATIRFVAAKNFTRANRTSVDVVVIHTMEAAETSTTAENVAAWGAGPNAPQASWHYAIDDDSIVQCVREEDVAWAAPSRNHNGIQLEHAGYARQTADQWTDGYSTRMLRLSAELTAQICHRWNIPVVFVDAAALSRGERGITTHWEISKGPGPGLTNHVDPGPHFPTARYLEWVTEAMSALET